MRVKFFTLSTLGMAFMSPPDAAVRKLRLSKTPSVVMGDSNTATRRPGRENSSA
jgi:hypothetical protein